MYGAARWMEVFKQGPFAHRLSHDVKRFTENNTDQLYYVRVKQSPGTEALHYHIQCFQMRGVVPETGIKDK